MKFRSLDHMNASPVSIEVDGRPVQAHAGEMLALTLLEQGIGCFNVNPVSGDDRLAYCLMGACFECRVVVDGIRDVLACRTAVRAGMIVKRQDDAHGTM
ncbi:(2Fe-2S)-binding protein [Shinella sp. PSBB067]|uniref:(2Fe-2S)-binding protein n=1 Tax=Shinella TaxID=323620 RepID=UPI00193B8228|nr:MULTISPECIES: (2Fe-2S)-binding protein [Shinella]QRI62540.1 (2Fe-2S)-binding protein [Shinella sp. PSBB067]